MLAGNARASDRLIRASETLAADDVQAWRAEDSARSLSLAEASVMRPSDSTLEPRPRQLSGDCRHLLALRAQRHSFDAQAPDRAGLEAFIRAYLSPQCADGCPSAALLDEIARRPAGTRQVFTDELMGVIDDIAARLDQTDPATARTDALTIFGMMIGTLQLARALTDRGLSDQLLARGVETALKLLDDQA